MKNEYLDTKDDNVEMANRNFTKLSNNLKSRGYADGKADGQESEFQKCFDQAYETGFDIGFKLGQCHGKDFAKYPSDSKIENEIILNKPSRGHCQICTNKSLINEPIDQINSIQTQHNDSIVKIVNEKF